jgi:hypothetical protein
MLSIHKGGKGYYFILWMDRYGFHQERTGREDFLCFLIGCYNGIIYTQNRFTRNNNFIPPSPGLSSPAGHLSSPGIILPILKPEVLYEL